jgi:tetratricopeptide (TPR) repeat protein
MEDLLDQLEYLPLAIVQAASYLNSGKGETLKVYLNRLKTTETLSLLDVEFKDLYKDREGQNAVYKTWKISFDQISSENERAADLLKSMSFFDRANIPNSILAVGKRHQDLQHALNVLKGFSLITASADRDAVDFHRLVQVCTREWLRQQNEYKKWVRKAFEILERAFPAGEHKNWSRCAELLPHAQASMRLDTDPEKTVERAKLASKVAWYLETRGEYQSAEKLQRQAVEDLGETLGKNNVATLKCAHRLGVVLSRLGRYGEAESLLRAILAAQRRCLGYLDPDTLQSCSSLSDVLWSLSKFEEAEKYNQCALDGRIKLDMTRTRETFDNIHNLAVFHWFHRGCSCPGDAGLNFKIRYTTTRTTDPCQWCRMYDFTPLSLQSEAKRDACRHQPSQSTVVSEASQDAQIHITANHEHSLTAIFTDKARSSAVLRY